MSGCTSVTQSVYSSLASPWSRPHVDATQLPPQYQYMKVTLDRTEMALVLAAVERTAFDDGSVNRTEIWYSGSGEVVRTTDGRITGTSGIRKADWRQVREQRPPSWLQALQAPASGLSFERERDLMPGNLFGLRERLTLTPITAPRSAVDGYAANQLRWFREDVQLLDPIPADSRTVAKLPASLYAVDPTTATVVYSEQCLSQHICLTLQPLARTTPTSTPQVARRSD